MENHKGILYKSFYLGIIIVFTMFSCKNNEEKNVKQGDHTELTNKKPGECPKGHSDSVVQIIYGYPSEEDFALSDSGLAVLGGCELPDNPDNWFCKKHNISFR